ncbi:ABC transporter ATP-binding protein [Actinotalea sp. K2]|uniref:dipeptide ABC transporter ATP-binding protein n=1 Tax=Actinotalea sp. K2 TaxID=2939438 RepID=UPI0020177C92|nr:ABC transporter ATP-binding protein [Actinotalea sp. K2]MCL3860266.1 ABC transporter ATP-binding protein [Actinotalea sp. K2]
MTTLAPDLQRTRTLEPAPALLRVENLRVGFVRDGAVAPVVRGISFNLEQGRCLAIVGESGSGKSVTARTLVGLTGAGARVEADRLELDGRELQGLRPRQWQRVRGAQIGFVLQDALVSLDQFRTVGAEVDEPLRLHRRGSRDERRRRVLEVLRDVGIPDPDLCARQRPYELSGGLRQRALIATALALDPRLVIADEPTTALDVTVQAQVLDLLAQTKQRGKAVLLISHDLSVVARLADEVCVMRAGEVVEHGAAQDVLNRPQHEYTRALLDAVPSERTKGTRLSPTPRRRPVPATVPSGGPRRALLTASGLVKSFRGPDGVDRTVVDDVSFELFPAQTLGIVGESGSGKTTTARLALAMLEPDAGEVRLDGAPWTRASRAARRPSRRRVGVVYQDPLSSFDPRWDVARILGDALRTGPDGGGDLRGRSRELLELVGMGEEHLGRSPLHLSGGQRQRVAIARALAPRPDVIVCDEPVSALDVSVQAQVLDLLTDLQEELGVAYLFISHDLGVIHHMCDRVLVMKDGRVVEEGDADDMFTDPQAPYTRRLLASLPRLTRDHDLHDPRPHDHQERRPMTAPHTAVDHPGTAPVGRR